MINLKKGVSTPIALTIIIVLAVVLVGGVFAYQYYYLPKQETKTPKTEIPKNETADWKTYRNEGYGFEVRYPKNWEIDEIPYSNRVVEIYNPATVKEDVPEGTVFCDVSIFEILLAENIKNLSLKEWINEMEEITSYSEITINKQPAIEIIQSYDGPSACSDIYPLPKTIIKDYYLERKGKIFRISSGATGADPEDYQKVLNQILSTFEFIEQ